MNSVLPSLTWGTWDDAEWAKADAHAASTASKSIELSHRWQSVRKRRSRRSQVSSSSQLWFEELLERVESTVFGRTKSSYCCNPLKCLHKSGELIETQEQGIPWAKLPSGIHPRDGKLPAERARNKQHQVDNLAVFLRRILQSVATCKRWQWKAYNIVVMCFRPGDVVVEFCAGSGYVALPLSNLFPQCTFVLLDKKEFSLAIGEHGIRHCCSFSSTYVCVFARFGSAKERIATARLTNVHVFCGSIEHYNKPFDVGVALHACGEATDLVMEKCLAERAVYVLAPCCVGKIKLSGLVYPRSATLTHELSRTEYEVLAKAADFGHSSSAAVAHIDTNQRRRRCKTLLESDRNMWAEEAQYETFMFVMHPSTATPKNDVLVGIPRNLELEATERGITTKGGRSFQLECEATLSTESLVREAIYSTVS